MDRARGGLLYLLESAAAACPLGQGERLEPGDVALLGRELAAPVPRDGLWLPGFTGPVARRCKCQIPVSCGAGVRARVVSGELDGVVGPLPWPALFVDVFLEPLAVLALPADADLRLLDGDIQREGGQLRALTRTHLLAWRLGEDDC
ncbi:hypothetical protein [Chitiniphilus eburneus]|uniref:Uncharacterized protein n=1 Tax=Chitiniphilus eburneus TaxID=2571148 RepID=A0A4U0PXL1_9NEIS|nr:hypothetical protein [Chitiniphilus eburneus]TJZ73326.1 hypothetical protein FAZ21_10720 [Chitiniphilus eburneus]